MKCSTQKIHPTRNIRYFHSNVSEKKSRFDFLLIAFYVYFEQYLESHVFCYECEKVYAGDNVTAVANTHPVHGGQIGINFPGIYVIPNFITPEEEENLIAGIDSSPWEISQSGNSIQVMLIEKILDFLFLTAND